MYFHFEYLNEFLKLKAPSRANRVGVFVLDLSDAARVAERVPSDSIRSSAIRWPRP